MTSDRYDELRAAAEAATPGPWRKVSDLMDQSRPWVENGESWLIVKTEGRLSADRENATFIALANPATITALLDERDSLLAALERFGEIPGEGDEDFPDDTPVTVLFGRSTNYSLHLGDLRRAAALTTKEG